MSNIPFPNVPDVAGVPALPRSSVFPPVAQITISAIQGIIFRSFQVSSQWGIFDKAGKSLGDPAKFTGLLGDVAQAVGLLGTGALSTNSLDYSKETRVSDFPIEKGSFASYNKVETPANPIVTLCFSGSVDDRRAFLDSIDAAVKSTELYSVVTPEIKYIDYSLERYNYQRRSSRGTTLLLVEITLKEIRQVSASYTQSTKIVAPKNAGATPSADNGKVQPKQPRTSTLKKLADKLPSLADTVGGLLR